MIELNKICFCELRFGNLFSGKPLGQYVSLNALSCENGKQIKRKSKLFWINKQ